MEAIGEVILSVLALCCAVALIVGIPALIVMLIFRWTGHSKWPHDQG